MSFKLNNAPANPGKLKAWIIALRPRTLPLAMSGIIMGGGLAIVEGSRNLVSFILCLLTALLLQLLSNLANDYGDFNNGADSAQRIGPARVSQNGWLSIRAIKRGIALTAFLALMSGVALLLYSLELSNVKVLVIFLFLGLSGIWAAYNYTAGNNPYGYAGWGDLSVMIFFGFIAVWGSYFLVSGESLLAIIFPSLAIACLSTAVLNLNNMRDIESDKEAGKITIPVRMGLSNAKRYHLVLMVLPFLSLLSFNLSLNALWPAYLPMLLLPIVAVILTKIFAVSRLQDFDPFLKKTALFTLLFSILWVISFAFGYNLTLQ